MLPLHKRLRDLTGGAIDKATQVEGIKRYLAANGVEVPTKSVIVDGEQEDVETLNKVALIETTKPTCMV